MIDKKSGFYQNEEVMILLLKAIKNFMIFQANFISMNMSKN